MTCFSTLLSKILEYQHLQNEIEKIARRRGMIVAPILLACFPKLIITQTSSYKPAAAKCSRHFEGLSCKS